MSRKPSEGVLQLHFAATISAPATPSLAEIVAGTDLTGFLYPNLGTPQGGQIIQSPDVGSAFVKTGAGTYGGQPITAEFYRDGDGVDTVWDALARGTTGYFVVARFGGGGAGGILQIADEVDVYTIEVAERSPVNVAENEHQRFTIVAAVTAVPAENAVVAV